MPQMCVQENRRAEELPLNNRGVGLTTPPLGTHQRIRESRTAYGGKISRVKSGLQVFQRPLFSGSAGLSTTILLRAKPNRLCGLLM